MSWREQPSTGVPSEERYCPNCGTARLADYRFCGACGLDFDALRGAPVAGSVDPLIGLAQITEDELTPRAAELVLALGEASASLLQKRLRVGFNRASRILDELERVGVVGTQDPRHPGTPRAVNGPENWLRPLR